MKGGGVLSRQLSTSHVTPRSLQGYQTFFRQNSVPETGWLEVREAAASAPVGSADRGADVWEKRWVVFGNGELSYSHTVDGPKLACIPMEKVISFRTDNSKSAGGNGICVTTTETKLFLRASSADEMKGWLFSFQLSVALVLSHLIENNSASSANNRRLSEFKSSQLQAGNLLSDTRSSRYSTLNGISEGSTSAFTRQSTNTISAEAMRRHISSRPSYTDLDIDTSSTSTAEAATIWERSRSTRNLMAHHDGSPSSTSATLWPGASHPKHGLVGSVPIPMGHGLSMSPAVPVMMRGGHHSSSLPGEVKLAGSYDYDDAPRLEELVERVMHIDVNGDERDESDAGSEASHLEESDGEDDGMLLFDLEEASPVRPRNGSDGSNGNGSGSSKSHVNGFGNGSSSRHASRSSSHSSSLPRYSPSSLLGGHVDPPLSWICGHCSRLGPRSANEDRLVAVPDLTVGKKGSPQTSSSPSSTSNPSTLSGINFPAATSFGFFAVYDGHCGQQASTYLQETLHERICRHPSFFSDINTAIEETCVQVDRDFLDLCKEKKMYCGTTALGAFVCGSQLIVFNIGDCQAVLCSGGVAVDMSTAHQPGRPDERERITTAGGWITEEKDLYLGRLHRMDLSDPVVRDAAQQVNWVTIHRVCGELAVSRSIGDPDYKNFIPGAKVDAPFSWPDDHTQIFHADLVIPMPELASFPLTAREEFLLMASDGLWDVVTRAEAVARTRLALGQNKSPTEAAEELCDLAIKLGSSDNVTVVLVLFVHP